MWLDLSGLDDTFIIYEQVVFYCKLSMGIVAPTVCETVFRGVASIAANDQ